MNKLYVYVTFMNLSYLLKMLLSVCLVFYAFLIKLIKCEETVNIISQYLTEDTFNMTCILSDSNSAIVWNDPIKKWYLQEGVYGVTSYIPPRDSVYNCKIDGGYNDCNRYWVNRGSWKLQHATRSTLKAVTDQRWEGFTIHHTDGISSCKQLTYLNDASFKIHISIRTDLAYLYLCTDSDYLHSYCYVITLGKVCSLRKCYPAISCNTDLKKEVFFKPVVNSHEWNHFTIEKNNGQIDVRSINKKNSILSYYDRKYFKTQYLHICSSDTPGYWKLHSYSFIITDKASTTDLGEVMKVTNPEFYLTMYAAMCKLCTLKFELLYRTASNSEAIMTEEIIPTQAVTWEQVKILKTLPNVPAYVQLRVSTICPSNRCRYPLWAIDDVALCSKNEIRTLTTIQNPEQTSCQLVDDDSKHITQVPIESNKSGEGTLLDSNCPIGTFGKNCIQCSKVLGVYRPRCDNSMICSVQNNGESECSCATGYELPNCKQRCSKNRYGKDCSEECGNCQYPPCDPVNGECPTRTCLLPFTGPQCKIFDLPVLLNSLEIVDVQYTSITVQIKNDSYKGQKTPLYYKIQYAVDEEKNTFDWKETESFFFKDLKPIRIIGLNILTKYILQAVLITNTNESYNGIHVQKNKATTTCKLIEESDISHFEENTTVTIDIQTNDENCRMESYDIRLNGNLVKAKSFKFKITSLTPFSDYELTITNNLFNKIITIQFKTNEGIPSEVQQLKTTFINTTTIGLEWQPPAMKNGNIRHYTIKYKHYKYLGCNDISNNKTGSEKIITETSLSTVMTELTPYSQYSVEIVAATIYDGKLVQVFINTSETECPESFELPIVTNIESKDKSASITFAISDCTAIKGPIMYYITCECSDKWCLQESHSKNITSIQSPVSIMNLFPYSNYTVQTMVGRVNGKLLESSSVTKTFSTQIFKPNPIRYLDTYSKTNKRASFRLSPPYPPTGKLSKYLVDYCYKSTFWRTYCEHKEFEPTNCKLWPDLHCIVLEGLMGETDYSVMVSAKNVNTKANEGTSITVYTAQDAPTRLENLSYSWDDYYNLTLTWNHPNKTNGPLRKFVVKIESKNFMCSELSFPINESSYASVYNYTIPMDACFSSVLSITALAYNEKEGLPQKIQNVKSPPRTPGFIKEPSVKASTNSTIEIDLPTVVNFGNESLMYIIISTKNLKPESIAEIDALSDVENILELPEDSISWIASEFSGSNFHNQFILGDDSNSESKRLKKELYNVALQSDTKYLINIVLINDYNGFKRYKVYRIEANTLKGDEEHKNSNLSSTSALYALLLLLLIPVIIWIVIRKKDVKSKINLLRFPIIDPSTNLGNNSSPDVIPLTTNKENTSRPLTQAPLKPKRKLPIHNETSAASKTLIDRGIQRVSSSCNEENTENKYSKPIKITEFEKYVKESIENGELDRQHLLFPRGQTKPWEYGLLPQNKSKNRYNNLIAYDHTRVKLEKINNDPFSDYINANYIEGYNAKKAYIATQGPKVATVNDFWRMIWQENVGYIVMLANTIEGGKKKSEQYWPNVNESLEFGNINVKYSSSKVYADYEYRLFTVTNENVDRTVEQLHFTSWPDHGVPLYSQSLVPFLRKLLTVPQGNAPMVIHCSAGVGRTGTIILCDLCLRMAAREGVVDVLRHLHNLREQRANLVDNVEQYKLVHLVLLECLVALHTSITCDEAADSAITKLLSTNKLKQQMQYINETAWQDQAMRPVLEVEAKTEWSAKNRFQDILPSGYGRVYLSRFPVSDEHSDYINAVEVDGFRCPQQFIVTQQPLKHTVCDFWRMIDEKEVTTVVSLNTVNVADETSCIFWPTPKVVEIRPVPYLKLQFQSKIDTEYYRKIVIHMYNTKEKNDKRLIHLLSLKGWDANHPIPNSEESLLQLWDETEKLGRGPNPIVVTCHDGAKACGLFVALSFVIEKIKLEQECDVCLAVRNVRRNRKQFVTEMEQFQFLYQLSIRYLRGFDLYSNFTTTIK